MTAQGSYDTFVVADHEAGQRLDVLLVSHYNQQQSRQYFQALITNGHVLVNGAQKKKREQPATGDAIEVRFVYDQSLDLTPEEIPLDIVYEDDHLIAVNKPVGMVVHPAPGNWTGTFANALLYHCQSLPEGGDPLRPGIVHRLDKDTSGLLLAAKTMEAQQKLVEMFAQRQMDKEYIAIVYGNPGEQTVDAPIGRHQIHRKMMCVTTRGRSAITHLKTMGSDERMGALLVNIETGRTHQIRVHCKHISSPVVGDAVYGNARDADRQLLHAYRLTFNHPITGEQLILTAPPPEDIATLWKQLVPGQELP